MVIKWLGAAAGPELAVIALLGSALIFGAGVQRGQQWERNSHASEQLGQEQELDDKSVSVALDTDKIVDDLTGKIDRRMAGQNRVNTEAIEASAKTIGRLEGEADGYLRGFKDAEQKLKGSCYTDPAFLDGGLRIDAEHRYESIFRRPKIAEPTPASPTVVLRGAINAAPSRPAN